MAKILTNQRDVPFELSFKYPLEKGYTFKEKRIKNVKCELCKRVPLNHILG